MPVHEAASTSPDKFGIGVAVSDRPLGPWTDHAGGPIVSQSILGNDAHNIDPTVLVDGDGKVWMYWGSFSRLMATQLDDDMKTLVGSPTTITSGVDGFFEAAWLFTRNGTYYLAYAANNAGPDSSCTPAVYHACIAYSTASGPLGPWTYQGRILAPVSSTTSHPAIAAPVRSTRLSLLPVSMYAMAIPGRAACDIASPTRLCRRSTANVPIAPATIPSTAAPSATVRNV